MVELSDTMDDASLPLSPSRFAEKNPSCVGAGLWNLGNTCFLNAVLQCFTHTVPLVQSLRSSDHPNPCSCDGEFCVFCALREHVELSLASSGGVISPLKLVENLSYVASFFRRYQQEDAHEFLQCMLDRLSSCVESSLLDKPLSSPDSFIKQIFGGRLRSQLKCCNCGHCSDTFEPLIDLSLEIEGVDALSTSLESFTKVEKIGDGEEKFTCGNCKEEVLAEKQLTIDQAPAVSVLHLKRFKSDGLYVEKINEFVKFPLELDLQPFISNPSGNNNGELKYDLYAVLVHIGISSDSGHYFCFIRSSPESWHRLDDSKVVRVSEDYVLNQDAYILFYKRKGSPWFLSLTETQKTCSDFSNASTSPRSVLDSMESAAVPSLSGDGSSGSEADETVDAPSTPPHKPSIPDISPKEPTVSASDMLEEVSASDTLEEEVNYEIPHVPVSQGEWKLPANKVLEDGRAKQSLCRLLRGMPNSRSSQLLACISPQSEGSHRTKRRRMSQPDVISHSQEETRSERQRSSPSNGPRSQEEARSLPLGWNLRKTVMQSMASGDSNMVVQFDSI